MGFSHIQISVRQTRALAAVAILFVPAIAHAGETAQFLNAPAAIAAPVPKLAVEYELKLRLPEGSGLARLLLDAGVARDDAAAVARLAAGHVGSGLGGCDVKIAISKAADGNGLRLVRAMLMTEAGQTVIERRGAELTIASQTVTRKFPRLV